MSKLFYSIILLRVLDMKYVMLNEHLKKLFGERVQRIPLDAGLICPNRNNASGCIFCDDTGSAAPWITKGMSIREQFDKGVKIAQKRYGTKKYMAYFQAYTSTAAPVEILEKLYNEVLGYEGVVGLAVSTRPDCVGEDVIGLLEELNKKTCLWVELGAQSMNDKSLEWMKRGHDASVFKDAVKRLSKKDIEVIGHVIFGLPSETKAEMLSSFKEFIATGIRGYKIHALHIIKDTELSRLFERTPFDLLTMEEYVELVREALRMTPSGMIVHRLTGEVTADKLVAPLWVLKKQEILRRIFE